MAEEDKKDKKDKDGDSGGGGDTYIIKKIKKGGGHHGGAWKVAYADFVTAMMAFFLLLWLLNVTTDEQKNAISNYFDPTHPKVSLSESGAGGVMGGLSMSTEGSMATNLQPITQPPPSTTIPKQPAPPKPQAPNNREDSEANPAKKAIEKAKETLRNKEEQRFKDTAAQIKQAIQDDPDLAALSKNLIIDMTPEGLRIQIVDQEGDPMFASGSAQMYQKTQNLMVKLAEIIQKLPNELSIRGHTDSSTYPPGATYTNWELSADRANASRRSLLDNNIPAQRINNVVGKADTEHLIPDEPKNPKNRRISIVLLKEELTNPDYDKMAEEAASEYLKDEDFNIPQPHETLPETPVMPPIGTFRRTPGNIEFP